jgi:Glycine/serine hydroxymethyltransferase
LIAGGKFQDPLREGADVLTASTHKTFPGPQGGVIFCKKELAREIDLAVFPGTVSNHHLHHLAAFGITLAEMKEFGQEYAEQVIKNAKHLAKVLYKMGFNALCKRYDFTESHQIVIDVADLGGGREVAVRLEDAGIILNGNLLPLDSDMDVDKPSGIRIGTQELTRIGMKEEEMKEVAEFLERVLLKEEPPERVNKDVVKMKKRYQHVHYCFDTGRAYDFSCNISNLLSKGAFIDCE